MRVWQRLVSSLVFVPHLAQHLIAASIRSASPLVMKLNGYYSYYGVTGN